MLIPFSSGKTSIDEPSDQSEESKGKKSALQKTGDYSSVEVMTSELPETFGFENPGDNTDFVGETVRDPGCNQVEFILQVLEERIRWSQKQENEKKEFTRSGWRGRKLFLTLRCDQRVEDRHIEGRNSQIEHIRARFQKFNYTVKILPSESRPDSYIILFPGRTMAQKALLEANTIGYKLVKKRPPRPSPKCPVMFKALQILQVRSGKALSAQVISRVKKGDFVIVNQVKGRRARLVEVENGKVLNVGWVSVHTVNGAQLLQRCDLSSSKIQSFLDNCRQPINYLMAVE